LSVGIPRTCVHWIDNATPGFAFDILEWLQAFSGGIHPFSGMPLAIGQGIAMGPIQLHALGLLFLEAFFHKGIGNGETRKVRIRVRRIQAGVAGFGAAAAEA
jgi:hypothetical protein